MSNTNWNITDIYKTTEDWNKDVEKLKNFSEEIQKYKGKLNNGKDIFACLDLFENIQIKIYKLINYYKLQSKAYINNLEYSNKLNKLMQVVSEVDSMSAFINIEILKNTEEDLEKMYNQTKELNQYKKYIKEIFEAQKHILTEVEEKLLSKISPVINKFEQIYGSLSFSDLKYDSFEVDGKKYEVTNTSYIMLLENKDREVRLKAYKSMYKTLRLHENIFKTLLNAQIIKNNVIAKIRNYKNSLEAALYPQFDETIYLNLIKSIKNHIKPLHEYMDYKRQLLNLDELYIYDVYVNPFEFEENNYTMDEAKELIIQSTKIFGNEYIKLITSGMENDIDSETRPNKYTGAFCYDVYTIHPYVLINYKGKYDDVSTKAHEMGHYMHSIYTNKNQSFLYSGYTTTIAEIASTVNELLLFEYMYKNTTDKDMKKFLLYETIESIRGTIYRQAMFAEFEYLIHKSFEEGKSIDYCEEYYKIAKIYFGDKVILDDEIRFEWMRISHFYYNFYVYNYALAMSISIAIVKKILAKEDGIIERYLNLLSSGSSKPTIELLKEIGFDLTSTKPVDDAMGYFQELVQKLKSL